jgi:tetratricopeptide (TPR) repeat protein
MNIRPKTIRRLILLGGMLALAVLLATGVLLLHRYNKHKQLIADRDTGLAAYNEGDYVTSLDKLKSYVGKYPEDFDTLYIYAVSRNKVEMSGDRHLGEAKALFIHLLGMRPGDFNTSHRLLELYNTVEYNAEAIDLADKILAVAPEDIEALRCKSTALTNQKKFKEALDVSLRLNQIAPQDLAGQLQTRDLLCIHLKRSPANVLEHYQSLQQAHPDDGQFEFLLGTAYAYANDLPNALKWLRQAAQRPANNAELVRWLSVAFDRIKLFDESQQLLERAASVSKDPAVTRVLVERFWQNDRHEQVVERLKDLDAKSPSSDADLLAFKAMSLMALKRTDEAAQIITSLKARKGNNSAAAWAMALSLKYDDKPDTRESIAKYENALSRDRNNAVIRFWIGEAYLKLGETELALRNFKESAHVMQSWVKPQLVIARASLMLGRTGDAIEAANVALRGAPGQDVVARTWALAYFRDYVDSPDPAKIPPLLSLVKQIQQRRPFEVETLPIHITLLSRSGERDTAIAVFRDALKQDKIDPELLSRLLAVTREEKLGMESDVLSRMQGELGNSPRVAFERAVGLAREGRPSEGMDLLNKSAADTSQWRLVLCEYRDVINDPSAKSAWVALGDASPEDVTVQTAILKSSSSALSDRDFYLRTIERVRKLTGDSGVLWRLHRAKWLLASENHSKDSAEAVPLLTELVRLNQGSAEYRVLLAQGLLNLGSNKETIANAIAHLKVAVDLEPRSTSTILTLAKLLQGQGARDELRDYLQRAVKSGPRNVAQRQELSVMLARTGMIDAAYQLLAPVESDLSSQGQLLLAELSRRRGLRADAERLFKSLLANPAPDAESLAAAADFYASTARMTEAKSTLDRLNDSRFSTQLRSQILARFYETHGTLEEARAQYLAAARDSKESADAWRELINFDLRKDQYDSAIQDSDAAIAALPGDASLADLKAQATALKATTGTEGDLTPLIEVLAKDQNRAPQVELLRAIQEIRSARPTIDAAISRLKPVADKYPDQFAAQALLTRMLLSANRITDAAAVAERTMEVLPNDPQAAQLTVGVYQKAGKWREMKRSAEKWRERTLERPQAADLAIAEAQLNLGDPAAALQGVLPYLDLAKYDPKNGAVVLRLAGHAMILQDRIPEARALLEPLLDTPSARFIFVDLASTSVSPIEQAKEWLSAVAARVPKDNTQEQFQLAQGYYQLSRRLNDLGCASAAKDLLVAIADKPDAPLPSLLLLAMIESQTNPAIAEKLYRRVLAAQPEFADAQNNLAYLLLTHQGDLQEARVLSSKAVTARPDDASFLDTLARIQFRLGDHSTAIKTFEQASKLDPKNVDLLIGLASACQADGNKPRVNNLLDQIDQLIKTGSKPSSSSQSELDALRQLLSRTTE